VYPAASDPLVDIEPSSGARRGCHGAGQNVSFAQYLAKNGKNYIRVRDYCVIAKSEWPVIADSA
jgi:hypothetical protein